MGRWAYARGFVQFLKLTISVVLRIAGLPEPSIHKPSDTMPFLFSGKKYEVAWFGLWIFRGDYDYLNNSAARRLPLAEWRRP